MWVGNISINFKKMLSFSKISGAFFCTSSVVFVPERDSNTLIKVCEPIKLAPSIWLFSAKFILAVVFNPYVVCVCVWGWFIPFLKALDSGIRLRALICYWLCPRPVFFSQDVWCSCQTGHCPSEADSRPEGPPAFAGSP